MNDEIATIADDVLYRAIEDVTGLHFSGADDAEVQAFSVVLNKVLNNERTAGKFAQRVAAYGNRDACQHLPPLEKYRNIKLKTVKASPGPADPTADDYPSDASHSSATKVAEA